jgi:hypothetical protein
MAARRENIENEWRKSTISQKEISGEVAHHGNRRQRRRKPSGNIGVAKMAAQPVS